MQNFAIVLLICLLVHILQLLHRVLMDHTVKLWYPMSVHRWFLALCKTGYIKFWFYFIYVEISIGFQP